MKVLLIALLAFGPLMAQRKMAASDVVTFVRNTVKTQPDKDVAEFMKRVSLSDRLTDDDLERCIAAGAGPRTLQVLKDLANKSESLPVTAREPPKPVPVGPPPPSKEEQKAALDRVTEYAQGYVSGIPNFTCTQRTIQFTDPRNLEQYVKSGEFLETLSYAQGEEQYQVLTQNGTIVTNLSHRDLGGAVSSGEFGSDMREVFDPRSGTEFEWESWTTWHGRRAHKFFYRVHQALSHFNIEFRRENQPPQPIIAGYKGYLYVDAELGMIMRLTREAEDVPSSFPIQNVRQATEYEFTRIGDGSQEYLLPAKSEMKSITMGVLSRNEIRFTHYRRFGADVKFIPEVVEK
jgi:hypothetical protein